MENDANATIQSKYFKIHDDKSLWCFTFPTRVFDSYQSDRVGWGQVNEL